MAEGPKRPSRLEGVPSQLAKAPRSLFILSTQLSLHIWLLACLPLTLSVDMALSAKAGQLVWNVDIAYIQPNLICKLVVYHFHYYVTTDADLCTAAIKSSGPAMPFRGTQYRNSIMLKSDIYHRCWQLGVVGLLQCQLWQEILLFRAHCKWLKDVPDCDVLIDKRYKLDL